MRPGVELRRAPRRVDLDDVADEAEVDLDAVDDRTAAAAAEEPGVLAGEARPRAARAR